MPEIRHSTAGITFLWAVETTAGTRPTSGYQEVIEVTETPELSPTPGNIEVTPLSQTKIVLYVPDLKDLGGTLSYTANLSQQQITDWNKTIVPAYRTGIKEDKRMWFALVIPDFTDAFYYPGQPFEFGGPSAAIRSALTIGLPINPTDSGDWYPAPTDMTEENSLYVTEASLKSFREKVNTEKVANFLKMSREVDV